MTSFEDFWSARNDREKRILKIGGIVAIVLLVVGVLVPLNHSVAAAHQRIATKRADLEWMRAVGPELASAGPQMQTPTTSESLLVTVDRVAREAGLAGSLTSSEPAGDRGLSVRLEKAPFDAVIGWLARLSDRNGIRVESASIDAAGAPGMVNVGVTLRAR